MTAMKYAAGKVFSIEKELPPVRGCTVSDLINEKNPAITVFSLAENTDISAEIYSYHKFLYVNGGEMTVYGRGFDDIELKTGETVVLPLDTPVGMRSEKSCVYTEIEVRRDDKMNNVIKPGEVFRLADLVPYQDGRIVNMDIVRNDKMKFVVMAFDEGTGLSEHAAPGDAIIFALDGEGVITYEGQDHPIKAGENFRFARGGLHAVTAKGRFKMALLLTLER